MLMGSRHSHWLFTMDIDFADPKSQDKAGTQAAVEYVSSLIQKEVAAGISLDRIVVAGFSQVSEWLNCTVAELLCSSVPLCLAGC